MTNVEFEGDYRPPPRFTPGTGFSSSQATGMAGWLLKKGIIKDESQANGVLTGVVIFNIIVTAFVIYYLVL